MDIEETSRSLRMAGKTIYDKARTVVKINIGNSVEV